MKIRYIFLFLLFSISKVTFAQNDKQDIENVIELYFDGWVSSDTVKVSKAMHHSCHLKYFRDSIFGDLNKTTYLSRFGAKKERDSSIITEINSIDISRNIAQAKTTIKTLKATFIDYFNMIKTNEGWFIVDKVSVRI